MIAARRTSRRVCERRHDAVNSPSPPHNRLAPDLLLALLLAGVVAFAGGWPLLSAVPSGDDWSLIALVRHVNTPLDLYRYDHSFIYFYRPHALLLWWSSVALFGESWSAHYALNLFLHALNAALAGVLVRAVDGRSLPAACVTLLFAAHPTALGAAFWLSDRFDLLCTAGVLGALLAAERSLRGGRLAPLALGLCALLAAGSKEIGLVLVPALLLRLALHRERPWRWRLGLFALVALPMAAVFAARHAVLLDARITTGLADPVADIARGTWLWLATAPAAFLPGLPRVLQFALALGAAGAVAFAIALALRRGVPHAAPLAVAAALVVAPAPLLAPVTHFVLDSPLALSMAINFRFFYLPLAFAGVALALAWPRPRDANGRVPALIAVASLLVLLPTMLITARGAAQTWRDGTGGTELTLARAAAGALAARADLPARCRVFILGTGARTPTFLHYADVTIKSLLAPDAAAMRCVIGGERVPWYQLVRESPCDDHAWKPLQPNVVRGAAVAARRVGGLCAHFFRAPDLATAVADPLARFFRFDDGVLVELPRAEAARHWEPTP